MAGIFRRGRTWWARAQRKGKEYRRSLNTTDRGIAEKRFRQWLDDIEAAAWGERVHHTYDEAVERFIREHLPSLKPASATRYGVSLKSLQPHFGGKPLHYITSSSLSEFEAKRRTDGVKPGTIRRDLSCLSSMLTSAIDWEWIEDSANPVPAYLRRRAKRGLREAPPRTRYLTEEEEGRLLAAASPRVREAIMLAIETGLRREELFSLTWQQVDFKRGIIWTTTNTKSGRKRAVPMPPRAAEVLSRIARHFRCPYVLWHRNGVRFVQMSIGFNGACRRAGLTDLRWHDLRRTAGCRWLQRDKLSMAEVSTLLGHSGVAVTESRYAFLEAEDVAASFTRGLTNVSA